MSPQLYFDKNVPKNAYSTFNPFRASGHYSWTAYHVIRFTGCRNGHDLKNLKHFFNEIEASFCTEDHSAMQTFQLVFNYQYFTTSLANRNHPNNHQPLYLLRLISQIICNDIRSDECLSMSRWFLNVAWGALPHERWQRACGPLRATVPPKTTWVWKWAWRVLNRRSPHPTPAPATLTFDKMMGVGQSESSQRAVNIWALRRKQKDLWGFPQRCVDG